MSMGNRTAIVLVTGMDDVTIPTQFSDNNSESRLIEYVLNAVWTVADNIFTVFDHEPDLKLVESIAPFGVKIIVATDKDNILSTMSMGIEASKSELCFVVQGNTPFIKPNLIFALFEAARGYDAAIPKWPDGKIDPLLAVYRRKAFLRVVETNKEANTPLDIIDRLYAIRYVDVEKELKQLDPDMNSFFKINSDEDVQKARNIANTLRKK